jgi:hypothetical protein
MWTPGPALADHRHLRPPSPLCPRRTTSQSRHRQDPAPVRRAALCMVKSTPRFSGPLSRGVGPDHETGSGGRAVPRPRRKAPGPIDQVSCALLLFGSTSHLTGMAGLAPQPDPVVAVSAAPDVLARPFLTRPCCRVPRNWLCSRCAPGSMGIGWPPCVRNPGARPRAVRAAPSAVDRSEQRTMVVVAALACFPERSTASSRTPALSAQRWRTGRSDQAATGLTPAVRTVDRSELRTVVVATALACFPDRSTASSRTAALSAQPWCATRPDHGAARGAQGQRGPGRRRRAARPSRRLRGQASRRRSRSARPGSRLGHSHSCATPATHSVCASSRAA